MGATLGAVRAPGQIRPFVCNCLRLGFGGGRLHQTANSDLLCLGLVGFWRVWLCPIEAVLPVLGFQPLYDAVCNHFSGEPPLGIEHTRTSGFMLLRLLSRSALVRFALPAFPAHRLNNGPEFRKARPVLLARLEGKPAQYHRNITFLEVAEFARVQDQQFLRHLGLSSERQQCQPAHNPGR